MLRAFGRCVAMCCDMLGVVGSNLTIFKFEPTTPNMSQHGGQTHATCYAPTMLPHVALPCCDHLAGALSFGTNIVSFKQILPAIQIAAFFSNG